MPDNSESQARELALAKAGGAFLALAAGDALGWPQEIPRNVRGNPANEDVHVEFKEWTRRSGGHYQSYEEVIHAGDYSDDTQLTLAVARSRTNHGSAWWKAFTRVELPLWTLYERGGGGATKHAANAWIAGNPPWKSNKRHSVRLYFEAGGNGVAMRVLPHALFLAGHENPTVLMYDVVRDGLATHGHPRALVGATVYAYAAWSLLRGSGTLRFGELLDTLIDESPEWSRFPTSDRDGGTWFPAADGATGGRYELIWDQTIDEMRELLEKARKGVQSGALADDHAVLKDLGCFGRTKGAGTISTAAALYLVSRHAAQPVQGILRAAFSKGADTDTLAAMAGGLMGCLSGVEWLPRPWLEVQDAKYLRKIACRVAKGPDSAEQNSVEPLSSPQSIFSDLARNGDCEMVLGRSKRVQVTALPNLKPIAKSIAVQAWRLRTSDGQTMYFKKVRRLTKQTRTGASKELRPTMTQPEYLSQGINYLGILSQQLGDLRGITTLAHELIQNADDAKDESGNLSATRITFDLKDDALVVSNDAVFREIDFKRMQEVASGSKRSESGDRTTGAFGVGFISVYQVTDRPEIHSAGRRWILRPDEREDQRIKQHRDSSITKDKGTVFRLPWAFEDSQVRQKLKVAPVNRESIDSFVNELKDSLPKAILFLKKLDMIELRRNGEPVGRVTRVKRENTIKINYDDVSQVWRIMQGTFRDEALKLKEQFPSYLENNREDSVRIAIPDTLLSDGLLFATLPTEQSAGLPFHIDADFFSTSDRKSIAFEDTDDHRSEWNRAAIRAAASVIGDNLIPLRDMFRQDALTFWAILDSLRRIYQENANDKRKLFAAFWEVLRPSLRTSQTVYTESGQWLTPAETRIPTGNKEAEAVPAFEALGIEMVHRNLLAYRNILTSNGVGVLRVKDISDALQKMGLTEHPQPIPPDFQTHKRLELLWKGIYGILENTRGQSAKEEAVKLLRQCALAPGLGGRLWPCGSVHEADKRTCEIFANLMPIDVSFLAKKGVPLLEVLCPQFVPSSAIEELERLDTETLQRTWRDGRFDPATLLKWFDDYKKELSKDKALCKRLACIPVFPSAGNLRSLENLYMPGGFEDPIGVADLVDMRRLKGLSDFLNFLGAEELTFEAYALEYIPMAFSGNSGTPPETKRKLLDILATRIGEIRENEWLQDKLAETNIVECTDGEFRQPDEVYFPCKEVQDILRDFVHYACFPEKLKGRKELYRWLGVVSRPRPNDVLLFINNLTAKPPNQDSTQAVKRIMEAVGKTWATLDDNDKQFYDALKNREWLLAEERQDKWYRPGQLYAAYNKHLFESQAKFLDMPFRIQRQINDFLKYLGVKLSPQSIQVVRHLLECSKHNDAPPNGIYQWLNDKVQPNHLQGLLDTACLRVKGKYLRKDQVFWGQHRFGRFRVQLGPEFKSYQNLLQALGIRESPDHNDAFKVLKEVSKEVGNKSLNSEEKDVVLQCWIMLAEALERTEIDDAGIKTALQDIKCVPNSQDLLQLPSWMFFEDRPSLADKFGEFFKSNLIPRTERIWQTMEAAGVRPISEAVQGDICEATNEREDQELKRLATERTDLINTISNGASQLDSICFIRADQLKVKWHTRAFKQNRSTSPESVSAHLNRNKKTIYFTLQRGSYPWSAIARELAQAIAPGEEISSISPGSQGDLGS